MSKYGLTTFLEDLPDGFEFDPNEWPTHITQIDTFEIDSDLDEIIHKLKNTLDSSSEVTSHVIHEALLGPNKDIPVMLLDLTPEVKELHKKIVSTMKEFNAQFKRQFILEDNFQPHITISESTKLKIHDEVLIASVSLIDKSHTDIRSVIITISLRPQS